MPDRDLSRRFLLRALSPVAATSLAGCSGLGEALDFALGDPGEARDDSCASIDVTPPLSQANRTRTGTTGENATVDVALRLVNDGDIDRTVSITIRRKTEYEPLFERTFGVGRHRIKPRVAEDSLANTDPGTYAVTAATPSGIEGRTTWHVQSGRPARLDVVVTEDGGIVFEELGTCGPDCPGWRDSAGVDLPYDVPGADDLPVARVTRTADPEPLPRSIRVENPTVHSRTLVLELHHQETRLLRYEGEVRSRGTVVLPDLVESAGEFEVRVATLSGACLAKTWSLPSYSTAFHVHFAPERGVEMGCSKGHSVDVHFENSAETDREVVAELEREGTVVDRSTGSVAAGERTHLSLSYPVGGTYRLGVATETGHEWADFDFCDCVNYGPVTVDLTPGGPEIERPECGPRSEHTSTTDDEAATGPATQRPSTADDADPP